MVKGEWRSLCGRFIGILPRWNAVLGPKSPGFLSNLVGFKFELCSSFRIETFSEAVLLSGLLRYF